MSPWISLSASLGIAVLSPPCLCDSAALRIVLGVKWVVIDAAGYGGEECQNLDVSVPRFGVACLVSVCHSFSLFSGANTLLGLGREFWEAGKPQEKRFVVAVKHRGLSRIGPCLLKPASKMQTGLGSCAWAGLWALLHLCAGRSVHFQSWNDLV